MATHAVWNRSAAAATRRLISDFRPDVVQAHKLYPQLSVAPVVVAAAAGVPVVQWAHDYEFVAAHPEDDRGSRVDRLESTARTGRSTPRPSWFGVCVHGPRVSRWIVASRFARSVYARHGIECDVVELFQPRTDERPRDYESRRGVVFSGRLTEAKGVRDVVELAKHTPQLEITVAGTGPLRQIAETAASSLPNLHYEGFVDGVTAHGLVSGARVVVVPSHVAEAGGRVALEAMAAGTPVVAYPSGGLAEYVGDTGGGVLVPQEPRSLADAALRVSNDRNLWAALSSRGLEGVRKRHAPERYIERIEAIYDEVIERPSSS